jgi:hypothetical protein
VGSSLAGTPLAASPAVREKLLVACALACASCGHDYTPPGATGGASTVDAAASGDAAVVGTLPCDVHALLAAHCTTCHGDPPTNDAPYPLVAYADLTRIVGGVEVAQRALARMSSATAPMPPPPAAGVSSGELDTFAAWVNAGTPSGANACTEPDPFAAPPQCSTSTFWTRGDTPSPLMHPGNACVDCHPARTVVAGTVYATGHEPDDCNGAAGVTVVITDATGAQLTLVTNAAGNFSSDASVTFPIHAEVVTPAGTRRMVPAQSSGDCNWCHTQAGADGAPGRIVMP